MLRLDRYPCCALLLAGTLNLLLECPPVAVNPSLEISQYAHTLGPSGMGSPSAHPGQRAHSLTLIEGKDIRFTHYSTEQGLSQNRVDHSCKIIRDSCGSARATG
jgi:hypothetical protein